MKKEELDKKLVEELSGLDGGKVRIDGILPISKRANKRFPIEAKYIMYTEEMGATYCMDYNSATVWKCTNLSAKDIEAVLAEIGNIKRTVYVVTSERNLKLAFVSKVETVTKSPETAEACFSELAAKIRKRADDLGWECDENDTCIEAYERGYETSNFRRASIHKTLLS